MTGAKTDIAAYREFKAQLSDLRKENETTFDYEDAKGNKSARSHVHKLRLVKGSVDKVRKEEKAASLEYGRRVDAEAKAIITELDGMIEVHAEKLRAIEDREAQRVQALRDRLSRLKGSATPTDEDGDLWGSNYLADQLEKVRSTALDDSWGEYLAEAGQAKDASIEALERHLSAAQKRETEAIELQRLREAQIEAERIANEARIKEQATREAKAEADRQARAREEAHAKAMKDAETKAAREREESARKLREQQEAADRRELQLKLDAEKKERERLESETKARQEREARERDEANRKSVHGAIADALQACGLSAAKSTAIVKAMTTGTIPHITIKY